MSHFDSDISPPVPSTLFVLMGGFEFHFRDFARIRFLNQKVGVRNVDGF